MTDRGFMTPDAYEERIDELEEELRELSRCVLHGWTDPAFVRGKLHTRAVEIAHSHHQMFVPEGDKRCGSQTNPRGDVTPATCLLAKGHDGPHRNTQGYWR